jgi:hypothetical protein
MVLLHSLPWHICGMAGFICYAPLQSAINMNERLLEKLGDHFIGLWRFRIYGVRRLWCVTLHVNGYYFDTRGKPTISEALKAAIKVVEKAKKKTRKIIR